MDRAAGAEEMGTRREQPEGAASWVRVQPEKGAASVAGGAGCHTATLSVWAACGVRTIGKKYFVSRVRLAHCGL